MSSQKGNIKKQGPPKHQNLHGFKNTMHDTSKKTKMITSLEVSGVCLRCKEIIDWKIKYKKYKPLTQPKKCVTCQQKRVKSAYYIVCQICATDQGVCAKCGKKEEVIQKPSLSPAEEARQQSQLEFELRQLPERKRRTFYRCQGSMGEKNKTEAKSELESGDEISDEENDSDNQTVEQEGTVNTEDSACGSSPVKTQS